MTQNAGTLNRKRALTAAAVLVSITLAFIAGRFVSGPDHPEAGKDMTAVSTEAPTPKQLSHEDAKTDAEKPTVWTCSMHPHIRLPKPGKCPICGMDLVPILSGRTADGNVDTSGLITMSEEAKRLAEVETVPVTRERAYVRHRMLGMVAEDETRVASLTARIGGRLDEIFIDFTGVKVEKGDPMVTMWSPTLITSQVELFETIRSREYDSAVTRGAEEKLKQFGLTQKQIEAIKKKEKPDLYVTLRAPISGVVMKKNVVVGDFVDEGDVMYEITDLSKVWIKLDAYEADLPWIRYGQEVKFTTPAIPGRIFRGTVTFIDPILKMDTRTVKVRVEADNKDYALKPNMFVTGEIFAEVDHRGLIIKSEWAGKYICPIFPDQVYDEPGTCKKSNLPLKPASEFGYSAEKHPLPPLVIPDTAVLYTGKRSIVWVEVPDQPVPTYEMREVRLGPRAGNRYVVFSGLEQGEPVVVKGNFKIDSAAQIAAQSSMMSTTEQPSPQLHDHGSAPQDTPTPAKPPAEEHTREGSHTKKPTVDHSDHAPLDHDVQGSASKHSPADHEESPTGEHNHQGFGTKQ